FHTKIYHIIHKVPDKLTDKKKKHLFVCNTCFCRQKNRTNSSGNGAQADANAAAALQAFDSFSRDTMNYLADAVKKDPGKNSAEGQRISRLNTEPPLFVAIPTETGSAESSETQLPQAGPNTDGGPDKGTDMSPTTDKTVVELTSTSDVETSELFKT